MLRFLDLELQFARDLIAQLALDSVSADGLDGLVKDDLALVEGDAVLFLQCVGNLLRGHRAEQTACAAAFGIDRDGQLLQAVCNLECLLALTLALTLVLSSCGQDSYTTMLSADKVADKLLEVLSGRYHGADADYISESRFGANYRDLTEKCYDHIILLSDDEETNIDQIGVFHVINKSDVSGVADAVTSFVEAEKLRLRDLLTSYNPGELPKLEQAQVKVCGTYVFYSFLSEAETSAAITALEQTLRA